MGPGGPQGAPVRPQAELLLETPWQWGVLEVKGQRGPPMGAGDGPWPAQDAGSRAEVQVEMGFLHKGLTAFPLSPFQPTQGTCLYTPTPDFRKLAPQTKIQTTPSLPPTPRASPPCLVRECFREYGQKLRN